MLKGKNLGRKFIGILIILIIALLSRAVIYKNETSPQAHAATIKKLDEKKMTALGLTAAVAVTSTAVAAVPGDSTTPIAQQIAGLSTPLLAVVCAIYLEEFLLMILGPLSFGYLIPIACGIGIIYIIFEKEFIGMLALKLLVFALAIFFIIPASTKVMTLIEATFDEPISEAINAAENVSNETEKSSDDDKDSSIFPNLTSELTKKATGLSDKAKEVLRKFIDAIAILIITTCVVPIAVIFFFVWIINLLFGINIDMSNMKKLFLPKKEKV